MVDNSHRLTTWSLVLIDSCNQNEISSNDEIGKNKNSVWFFAEIKTEFQPDIEYLSVLTHKHIS